ncbi:MAG: DUF362 domain-containing protein [Methanobacteriota archaeon]|nr:MAG: DUF362 domain-containing protein [Euryarchaeota archaeon]
MQQERNSSPPNLSVAVVTCGSYEAEIVRTAVRRAVDSIGGMAAFVSKGEKILLKPNLLVPRHPDDAITTHPEVVRAVIRLVKAAGGIPVVGDSPAGRSTERILRHLAEKTGMAEICRDEDVPFVLFTEGRDVAFPDGRVAKSFNLTTALDDVDGIISLAKLKTHSFTRFTGGVKNLFGLVHGLKKAEYHMRMKNAESFSEMLVDLAEYVRPRLTLMDAVVGMDGDGPSAGRPKHIGMILASSNVHAIDVAALEVVCENPENVPTTRVAIRRGLLPSEGSSGVKMLWDRSWNLRVNDFKMPPKVRMFGPIPRILGSFAAEGFTRKPIFISQACTRCGSCVEVCPAEALSSDGKISIDRGACIRCYCCQEICQQKAVVLRRMPLRSWGRSIGAMLARSLPGQRVSNP